MKSNKIFGVIIQARMGSTRLPGKVLKKLSENDTVLDILLKRVRLSKKLDKIIIATTPDPENQKIINLAKYYNIDFFIGSEENVLKRYFEAARKFHLDIIVRITSDCPFVDPYLLDDMIEFYEKKNFDYIRNNYNSNIPRGFDIEILNFETLKRVYYLAKTKPEKEHVTYYIYSHPNLFSIYNYKLEDLDYIEGLRLTIDEKEDLIMCKEVYKKLKEKGKKIDFNIYDIIEIIQESPQLIKINKYIKQKNIETNKTN